MKLLEGYPLFIDRASEEARAKYVPAAAVIRTVRTLFGITGLKGCVGGFSKSGCEIPRLNRGTALEYYLCLRYLRGERNFQWSGEMC